MSHLRVSVSVGQRWGSVVSGVGASHRTSAGINSISGLHPGSLNQSNGKRGSNSSSSSSTWEMLSLIEAFLHIEYQVNSRAGIRGVGRRWEVMRGGSIQSVSSLKWCCGIHWRWLAHLGFIRSLKGWLYFLGWHVYLSPPWWKGERLTNPRGWQDWRNQRYTSMCVCVGVVGGWGKRGGGKGGGGPVASLLCAHRPVELTL